jgi:polar amino acid transport system substrate-binding protein
MTRFTSLSNRAGRFGLALALSAVCASAAWANKPLATGVDATFAPHAMPKLGGGIDGFNVELGHALAKQLGTTITIDGTEFSALIPGLNAKKYDFVLAPTTVTEARAKALLFSEGYLNTDFAFVQDKKTADMKSLDDLKGKTISVNKGSAYETWARDNAAKYGFKFDVYATNADAIQAVQSGRAYANMAGNTVAAWAAKQNPAVKMTYVMSTGLVWSLAFRLDDKEGRRRNRTQCRLGVLHGIDREPFPSQQFGGRIEKRGFVIGNQNASATHCNTPVSKGVIGKRTSNSVPPGGRSCTTMEPPTA